tara:strand:+ start:4151 stop:4471 length:321 start_codon:yes stop_codon:yes gene_type:complete
MSLYAQLKATVSYAAVCFYWSKKEQERVMSEIMIDASEEQFESLLPAACSGYVRMLREDDIYPDSSAQPGWFGYFDGDGDVVFWEEHSETLAVLAQHNGFRIYPVH